MENSEINLKELLELFWNKKKLIIIITILAIFCGFVYSTIILKPKYTAATTLILAQQNTNADNSKAVTSGDVTLNDKLISTYQLLAQSDSTVTQVIQNLGLTNVSVAGLKNEISVTSEKGTQILKISVTDSNQARAAQIANELAKVFSNRVKEIYKIENTTIVDEAKVPTNPSNINHKRDILISAVLGIILSFGIILILNLLDNSVKSGSQIEKELGLTVIAEIPDVEALSSK